MDANKLEVLRDVYQIRPCCGLCIHAHFAPTSDWGTCDQITYDHEKHTGPDRELSITKFGDCDAFEASEEKMVGLGAFVEFFNPLQ